MIGAAQLNEYSDQHGFEVGSDRTLCGVLLSLHVIIQPDLMFGDSTAKPLCAECSTKVG